MDDEADADEADDDNVYTEDYELADGAGPGTGTDDETATK